MRYSEELNGAFFLGRVGENKTTTVKIKVTGWKSEFGEGLFTLLHQRAGDPGPYPCGNVTYDATAQELHWLITNSDVGLYGKGELQVSYLVNDAIAKSVIYQTFVQPALGATIDPPEPWQPWYDEIIQARDDAEAARDDAEDARDESEDARDESEDARDASIDAKDASVAAKDISVAAKDTAITAKNDAVTAKTQAVTAKDAAVVAKTAAETAQGLAETAKTGAESARDSAVIAKTAAETAQGLAEVAEANAVTAKNQAVTAKDGAVSAKDTAVTAKDNAITAKNAAVAAQSAIENMAVAANTLTPQTPASVTKTQEGDHVKLTFGLPKGDKGDSGVFIGASQPTDPDINVWINPNDVANRGYVPSGGTTGQALVKHSGTNYDTEWKTISEQDPRIPSTLTAGKFLKVNTAATGFELADTHKYPYLYVFHWYRANGGYPLNLYMTMLSEGDMGVYNYQFRDYLMTHNNPIVALNGSCYIEKDGAYKLVRVEHISFYTQYSDLYAHVWHDDGDSFTTVVLGGQGGGDLTASTKILL